MSVFRHDAPNSGAPSSSGCGLSPGPLTYGLVDHLTASNRRLAIVSAIDFLAVGLVLRIPVNVARESRHWQMQECQRVERAHW
jgi:hypothetical protein